MRSLPGLPPFLRSRKHLSIAFVFILLVLLFHDGGTLDTPIELTKAAQSILGYSQKGYYSPEDNASRRKVRQKLAKQVENLFAVYEPPISEVDPQFHKNWPQIGSFQLNKTYKYEEVQQASKNFFLKEETYKNFNDQQRRLLKTIPKWEDVSAGYSGRGIVISAGVIYLQRVWPNVVLMLRELNCTLPIEIWTKDRYEYDLTLPQIPDIQKQLNVKITLHTLDDYMHLVFPFADIPAVFKVKSLALLYSSFQEVILLDADSIPVKDPRDLFDIEEMKSGLLQWPDFWANSVSTVLHDAYEMKADITNTTESGQLVINKKLQFEPLILANYFNWWGPKFFYDLIYLDSMGAGDKDTFYLASAAYHRPFHLVPRPIELIRARHTNGTLWKQKESIFNGAMAQFNPRNLSEIFFLHSHMPKIDMSKDELTGQWDLHFFRALEWQNALWEHGEEWLERALWKNLKWIECDSIIRNLTADTCQGITMRVDSMVDPSNMEGVKAPTKIDGGA